MVHSSGGHSSRRHGSGGNSSGRHSGGGHSGLEHSGDHGDGQHGTRSVAEARCSDHCLTDEFYLPQLRRLLSGTERDRLVYHDMVAEMVGSANPLDLFKRSQQRCGIYLIEALYRTLSEQAEHGDDAALPSLAPFGYSRWVAWRLFGDAVRNRSVSFDSSVGRFISLSRHDVARHVHAGWRPAVMPADPELMELLHNR